MEYKINKEEAQKLYNEGLSIRGLAKHYGCSVGPIQYLGLKTRTQKLASDLFERKFTKEGLEKLSKIAKERNLGGYRPHPNKGKRYKGIWFDSEWEVKVAKSLDKNNIKWVRPKEGFVWNDKGNKYYPDFFLEDYNIYLDPKNDYLIGKDKLKIEQAQLRNNISVFVLKENQLSWKEIKALIVQR